MEKIDTSGRLSHLRQLMKERNIDIYKFISGFSGSAGCAVVSLESATLSTDGRYFNQAEKQLDSNWKLLKQGLQDVPTWQEWTADEAKGGKSVGVDPTVITASDAGKLSEKIKNKGGKDLISVEENLVDIVWGKERPSRPNGMVKVLDQKFSGKAFEEKLSDLRKELEKKKSPGFVVSMLDEVAWLFNLRGSDIPYNPVFFSYALITPDSASIYVDSQKLSEDVMAHLGDAVKVLPYEAIFDDTRELSQALLTTSLADVDSSTAPPTEKFLVSTKTSWALSQALGGKKSVEEIRSPIEDAKAVKNEVELQGMRACHVRDGAALIEYFAWLEERLLQNSAPLDEVQGADKLEEIRSKHQNFVGLSFDAISSSGANAAVIHYSPERGSCSVIDPKAIYLCDSGAQYLDGTTDTTRTLHFGEPTEMERKAYTLVLKGHIALDRAVFPTRTTGFALDTLARQFLWLEGLDYRHGTGHGVGSYLNVHEGPIGIGSHIRYSDVPLAPGNVLSNEPGYYEDGSFGIRIENIVIVKEANTKFTFGEKPYLAFEHVTMVPMCQKLIDTALLTSIEKDWLNTYHAEIFEKTKGYFEKDSRSLQWLEKQCHPL